MSLNKFGAASSSFNLALTRLLQNWAPWISTLKSPCNKNSCLFQHPFYTWSCPNKTAHLTPFSFQVSAWFQAERGTPFDHLPLCKSQRHVKHLEWYWIIRQYLCQLPEVTSGTQPSSTSHRSDYLLCLQACCENPATGKIAFLLTQPSSSQVHQHTPKFRCLFIKLKSSLFCCMGINLSALLIRELV